MEIERIEDWVGQEVVDPDGEKVGKLEDVFYAPGGNDAVAATVKSGVFGRKLRIVPLDGATVTRDHVRVSHSRDSVKNAPESAEGADLASGTVSKVNDHFGVALPSGELESATAREERELRAREAEDRAAELERVAQERRGEADERDAAARESDEAAAAAEKERAEAAAQAEQARRDAGGAPPEPPARS